MSDYFYIQLHSWYVPNESINFGYGHVGLSILDSRTGEIGVHVDASPKGPDGVIDLPGELVHC